MRQAGRARGFLAGLLSGASGGLFGVGGGVVLVPLLTARFGLTQHQAHGTSLAVVGVTALAGLAIYGVMSRVEWVTAGIVALSSIVTARFGARLAARTSGRGLKRAFAIFLVAVAIRLLVEPPVGARFPIGPGAAGVAFDLVLGAAVGLLSGFLGVGGGLLAVPAFTLLLGMSQQAAQGTSLAVILVTAPAGAIEHARHGNLVRGLVPILALGALVGAPLASWAAQVTPHQKLVQGFALFLFVNAVVAWVQSGRGDAAALPGERSGA